MLIFVFGIMILGVVQAKSVEKINWKAEKLTIKEDGAYNSLNEKIKDKEKSEIWIDKKLEKANQVIEYHVDSLVQEDTFVTVQLYYEVQPDTIYYRSHTGKYEEYVSWNWADNETGGWALMDVYLEYGVGSNTFTSAISGATWKNDGINITLTDGVDYSADLSTGIVTVLGASNASWMESSYDYKIDNNTSASTITHLIEVMIAVGFIALIVFYIKSQGVFE